ncbi:MAG: ROK family protein [Candidatus Binataceae bacterium]
MKKEQRSAEKPSGRIASPLTLAVDIGGTGIKSIVLDARGRPLTKRLRTPTPNRAKPREVIAIVKKQAKAQGKFDRVSVGFPGVVKDGVIYTAANLGKGWNSFNLERELIQKLDHPVRVANDADVQGLSAISGNGIELVITLGTGFGSVLFANDMRIHLELGHHPFHNGKTYEDELGRAAMDKKGKKRWNRMLREAIDDLKRTFNYDRLYIGGGGVKFVNIELPDNVSLISNEDGLLGGLALWHEHRTPNTELVGERVGEAPNRHQPLQDSTEEFQTAVHNGAKNMKSRGVEQGSSTRLSGGARPKSLS